MTKPGPPPIQTISPDYHFCELHDIVSVHLVNSVTKHKKNQILLFTLQLLLVLENDLIPTILSFSLSIFFFLKWVTFQTMENHYQDLHVITYSSTVILTFTTYAGEK